MLTPKGAGGETCLHPPLAKSPCISTQGAEGGDAAAPTTLNNDNMAKKH